MESALKSSRLVAERKIFTKISRDYALKLIKYGYIIYVGIFHFLGLPFDWKHK